MALPLTPNGMPWDAMGVMTVYRRSWLYKGVYGLSRTRMGFYSNGMAVIGTWECRCRATAFPTLTLTPPLSPWQFVVVP